MTWLVQFETADGLKARETHDFNNPHPPKVCRRAVKNMETPISDDPNIKTIETGQIRYYELIKVNHETATCIYQERINE